MKTPNTASLHAWHAIVAGSFALAACVLTLGRIDPLHPSIAWALGFAVVFLTLFAWLSRRAEMTRMSLRTSLRLHAPLALLPLAAVVSIYASDDLNHQVTNFLQPTAPVLLLLLLLSTMVAGSTTWDNPARFTSGFAGAVTRGSRWTIPTSLLLLGLVQGGSYLWMIGNDFTRYWNIADAIREWSGYPGMITLPDFVAIGEPPYTIDLPGLSLALIPAFGLLGHDTFAAYVPNLLANALFPLLLYCFYRGAGIGRPLAFAGSCVLATMPFLRLYTLNAPLPDTIFMALLVGTTVVYERLIRAQSSGLSPQSPVAWLLLGVLAGLTLLTRTEGIVLLGFMALGLLPNLKQRGPWLAATSAAALILPFAAVMYSTFGFFWPNNAGGVFSQRFIVDNVELFQDGLLRRYAEALAVPESLFVISLAAMLAGGVVGAIWLARVNWRLSLLPLGAAVAFFLVLMVNPTVSGARLWFDFFRHISYGIPFLSLAPLFLLERLSRGLQPEIPSGRGGEQPRSIPVASIGSLLAAMLIAVSLWQMVLLMRPSQTYGSAGTQLLNSDVWVTVQDLASHRYLLPVLPHARDSRGVLIIEPNFDRQYLTRHLDLVRQFFEPYTVIVTNRGAQYEVSSILLVLFGAVFALSRRRVE